MADEKWIQKAIKRKGALTRAAKRAGALTKEGKIAVDWLRKQASSGNDKTARRARLALTLRRLNKNR